MKHALGMVLAGSLAACSSPSATDIVTEQCEYSGESLPESADVLAFCECLKAAVPADSSEQEANDLIQINLQGCKEKAGSPPAT
ncbi:MAG: hypothetical protein ABJP70_10690 [Erythrobacter sp.]